MKTKVLVKIEDRHIDRGIAGRAGDCALALAVSEAIPLAERVMVTHSHIRPIAFGADSYTSESLLLPEEVKGFPRQFDEWLMCSRPRPKPCTFELEVDDIFVAKPKPETQPIEVQVCA